MKNHYHVVAAVVEHEGQYLCVRKGQTRYSYTSNVFEFPGGKVEPGETESEAIIRELQEEMDYSIIVDRHLTTVSYEYPDFSITLSAYICHPAKERDSFVLKEHIENKWLAAEELTSLSWAAADDGIVEAIKEVLLYHK